MARIVLTENQRSLARHALGLPHSSNCSWRNHYVVGSGLDHEAWSVLVREGLARRRPGSSLTGGDDLFWLTQMGAEAVLEEHERLNARDFPLSSFAHGRPA